MPKLLSHATGSSTGRIVAIGASAGGVEALGTILSAFPRTCPPTLIVQHIPDSFSAGFIERLNRNSSADIAVATEGAALKKGTVFIAPANRHLMIAGGPNGWRCRLSDRDPVHGFRPSIDVLFESMTVLGTDALGVILTGMGRDGVTGLKSMRDSGAATIGQDQATSIVYGMPKAAFEAGAVERQVALRDMPREILRLCDCRVMETY